MVNKCVLIPLMKFVCAICEKIFNCVSFRVSTVAIVIVIQIFIKIKLDIQIL